MVRPWPAALGLAVCSLVWLGICAGSVGFQPPRVVGGMAVAAEDLRLGGLATALHLRAAAMHRDRVARLRDLDAPGTARQEERFALADELGRAGELAAEQGNSELGQELVTEALRAAPERVDLRCRLVQMQTREKTPDEQRVALLGLVLDYDAACAHFLAGQSFLEAGDLDAAEPYLRRAAELRPDWARPHLLLARLYAARGNREQALASAVLAMQTANDPQRALAAARMATATGANGADIWQTVAGHIWRGYWEAGALALAFIIFLVHPALLRALRSKPRGDQASIADSAS